MAQGMHIGWGVRLALGLNSNFAIHCLDNTLANCCTWFTHVCNGDADAFVQPLRGIKRTAQWKVPSPRWHSEGFVLLPSHQRKTKLSKV